MTAPPPPPPARPPAPRRRVGRGLAVCLLATSALVLVQATTAGLFLSGTADARLLHTIVGSLLPYAAIAVAVVAGVQHRRRTCPPGVAWATYALPVLLWAQMALGHVPAAATTAVHVPLGVALAVYPVVLAMLARPSRPRP